MPGDYYATLGVSPDASPEEIKRAFRRLAREYHPDATGGDPGSEQRYKEISEAYAVLSDPDKRRQYDAARVGLGTWSSPWSSPFSSTIEEIFESFFGGSRRAQARPRTRAQRGESIEVELEVGLREVVFGGQRTLKFERYETCGRCGGGGTEPGTHPERCSTCGGTGQVQQARRTVLGSIVTTFPCGTCGGSGWHVPNPCRQCRGSGRFATDVEVPIEIVPGIDTGDRVRLEGEGEAGVAGGGRGDLYVRFRVAPDERFERVGDDLVTWASVPMTTAALGGEITVETLDGEDVIEVRPGTETGEVVRLRGRGVPRRGGRGRGDLVVRLHVQTPRPRTKRERELLRELAAARGEESGPVRGALRRMLGWE